MGDSAAQSFVKERHARAVTFGQDIYLGPGVHSDNAAQVSHTLAHEVAHTLQQRDAPSHEQGYDLHQYTQLEQQADQAADRVTEGRRAAVAHNRVGAMQQAEGEATAGSTEISPQVRMTEVMVILTKTMNAEQRAVLQSHPPTYQRVVRILIEF